MDPSAPTSLDPSASATSAVTQHASRITGRPSLLRRSLIAPVKFFWGMAFCQGLFGGILVVGWTYRLAQRAVLKYWWSLGPGNKGTFADFMAVDGRASGHAHWPNWFCQQNFLNALRRQPGVSAFSYALSLVRAFVHSFWLNFWIGLRAILNTWVLTLPACILWWFGWYDGWNNSFSKGYEQAAVGPLVSIIGIFLFIAVMFYVPLAQARQAATGDWRSFYQFRLIWTLARYRWLSCVGLACLYSLLAIPLMVMKIYPMFAPQNHPEIASMTDPQLLKYLNDYFFRCAIWVLPAFVILRLVAARIYASAILPLVQCGKLQPAALSEIEREHLERLGLLNVQPGPERHLFIRLIAWTGTRVGRIASGIALFLIWFSFVAQIYIAEFFNYHGGLAWLNQPLVQLPWFHYLPMRFKNPSGDLFFALLIFLLALLCGSVWRTLHRAKR